MRNSRGGAEARRTGYLESTENPGPRFTLAEKGAATPGESSDGLRQRRNAAESNVKPVALDLLRVSAPPREIVSGIRETERPRRMMHRAISLSLDGPEARGFGAEAAKLGRALIGSRAVWIGLAWFVAAALATALGIVT